MPKIKPVAAVTLKPLITLKQIENPVIISEPPVAENKDSEPVVKTKLNQLMSFNLDTNNSGINKTSLIPSVTLQQKQNKVNSITNTDSSVQTQDETDLLKSKIQQRLTPLQTQMTRI